jgi:hypothetical protein
MSGGVGCGGAQGRTVLLDSTASDLVRAAAYATPRLIPTFPGRRSTRLCRDALHARSGIARRRGCRPATAGRGLATSAAERSAGQDRTRTATTPSHTRPACAPKLRPHSATQDRCLRSPVCPSPTAHVPAADAVAFEGHGSSCLSSLSFPEDMVGDSSTSAHVCLAPISVTRHKGNYAELGIIDRPLRR